MSTLAVPQASLDWRILSNISIGNKGDGTTDYRHFFLTFKQVLTNTGGFSGIWRNVHGDYATDPRACAVAYSSDGNGNAGASDLISGTGSIVMGSTGNLTTNHTYFVLTFPGIGANAQLLFDYASNAAGTPRQYGTLSCYQEVRSSNIVNNSQGGFLFSQDGGFSGGTPTKRPWAAKETQILNRRAMGIGIQFLGSLPHQASWSGKLHVARTADGSCTRMIFFYNGVPIWFFFLEVPGNPFRTNATTDHLWNADDVPWFGAVYGSTTTTANAGLYNGTPNWAGTTVNLVTTMVSNVNPTTEAIIGAYPVLPVSAAFNNYLLAANESSANVGDGGYYPLPVGLSSGTNGYIQPWLGTWQDMYLIGNNLTDGSSGAEDASTSGYSWRKVGNFLFPWDRSIMQTT